MLPRALSVWLLTGSCLIATTASAAPPIEPFVPASASDRTPAVLPPASPAAAGSLRFDAQCNEARPRFSLIALHWQPGQVDAVSVHQVDISKFRDGFDLGRFDTTRELTSATTAVAVDGPEPGLNYYWRVRTKTAAGWAASPVARFEVPVCPYDGLDSGDQDEHPSDEVSS